MLRDSPAYRLIQVNLQDKKTGGVGYCVSLTDRVVSWTNPV